MLSEIRYGKALKSLLNLSHSGSITIYGRGYNDKGEELYEVSGKSTHLTNYTACQVVSALVKGEKETPDNCTTTIWLH